MTENIEHCPDCGEWGLAHVSGDTYLCEQCRKRFEIKKEDK